ncbi:MAG: hypothetical protein ACYDBP_04375 [Leptospirales bacterium]
MNIVRNPKIVTALVGVLIVWVNGVMGGMIAVLVLDRHDREISGHIRPVDASAGSFRSGLPPQAPYRSVSLPPLPVPSGHPLPGDADRRKAGILAQVAEYPSSRKPVPQAILPVPVPHPGSVPKSSLIPPGVDLPKEGN